MPFSFRSSKASPSQTSHPDRPDFKRSHSNQLPSAQSDPAYDPYRSSQQAIETYDSASQNFQQPLGTQPAPDRSSIAGPPYSQYSSDPKTLNRPFATHEDSSGKKSLKSRLLFAAASAREESSQQQDKTVFGRRKSVQRLDSPSSSSQEPSAYQENSGGQWSSQDTRPIHPRRTKSGFDPFTPDFKAELVDRRDQQPLQAGHRQDHTPYQQSAQGPHPIFPPQYSSQQNSHLGEPTTPSAGSQTSPDAPNRPSFDSLQQPPSVATTNSRPSSRQSTDPRINQHQYLSYTVTPEPISGEEQPANPAGFEQARPTSAAQRVAQFQQFRRGTQQGQNDGEQSFHRTTGVPLQASNMLGTGPAPHNNSGHSPNPTAGSSTMNAQGQMASQVRGAQGQGGGEVSEMEFNQLMEAHREVNFEFSELKKKYNNVKRQYFAQKEQVDSLHNTLANQRLTVSRTLLDDGEYVKRMGRLDGLISQLAFGIRKDWSSIPDWLQGSINKDAVQIGKQEMTAVGRAFMSRWLVAEVFDKYFHPDLPVEQSIQLKTVQRNIRAFAASSQCSEDDEALTARVNNWRLSTVDGLRPLLSTQQASTNREELVELLSTQLKEDCSKCLKDPLPADLIGGIPMIIELAVGVLTNLPQESRDVHIEYFMPGQPISEDLMSIESGIPALAGGMPTAEGVDSDHGSGNQSSVADSTADKDTGDASMPKFDEASRKGFLGSFIGGSKKSNAPTGRKQSNAGLNPVSGQSTPASAGAAKEELARVRLCVFLAIQIRGKMILAKAPVYKA